MQPHSKFLRSRASVLCAGLTLISILGCGDSDVYQLKTADLSPLPIALTADSVCLVQLMDGKIALEKGRFTMDYVIRRVCPTGSTPLPDPGTRGKYDIDQGVITFRDSLGRRLDRGEVRGDTLIISGKQHILRFLK
jgi:hypothetical protein